MLDADAQTVTTYAIATGGSAVARLEDGRVVFVAGALPDETVKVELTQQQKRYCHGFATEVLEPSPHRQEVTCAHALARECGGCDWLYVETDEQRRLKVEIVTEQLERLGGVDKPAVRHHGAQGSLRTTTRAAVVDGLAGYRAPASHDTFAIDDCQALHPLVEHVLVHGSFGDASEVTVRASVYSSAVVVQTNGDASLVEIPQDPQNLISEMLVIGADSEDAGILTEKIGDRLFRFSINSFAQSSPGSAANLVEQVAQYLTQTEGPVIDLYSGVGLLGSAAGDRLVAAVESSPDAAIDARFNLGDTVRVINSKVEKADLPKAAVAIADPARRGLGKQGVRAIERTGASAVILVSCDPAALGRDVGLLAEAGFAWKETTVVDMFPGTSQIEAVTLLTA